MFRTDGDVIYDKLLLAKMNAEDNYRIKPFDRLLFRLYSNQGQLIQHIGALDGVNPPDPTGSGTMSINPNFMQAQGADPKNPVNFNAYTVQVDGYVYLPVVGAVYLEGLTARQADSLLSIKYSILYKNCFVRTQFLNKRVIVFKGAKGEVVPLINENTTLIEILAQTGGVPNDTRATNIRLIRGDLKNPNVFVIDLSTIEGMRRINLQLQPDDIIYVEPIRKTFLEAIGDISPVISFITSMTTFVLTVFLLRR